MTEGPDFIGPRQWVGIAPPLYDWAYYYEKLLLLGYNIVEAEMTATMVMEDN